MEIFVKIVAIGIFATIVIDIWAIFSNKILKFPRTSWAMVGRWIGHLPAGKFFHGPVSASPKIKFENVIGWLFHYFIGVTYAAIYVVIFILLLGLGASLLWAWVFGLLTILSPWLIMQPALGLGVCAVKAPNPNMVRLQNFAIHSIFGLALYHGWRVLNA